MTTDLESFATKDETTIRADFLRSLKNGLILDCGIANPNVYPGSDYYVLGTSLGLEVAPIYANCQVLAGQLMPDTATGTYLARIGTNVGLTARPASGGLGYIVHSVTASSLVPTGAQLTDAAGLRFQVTTGGTYANGAFIPVAAIDTGATTNHAAGDVLSWQSAPPFSAPTVLVANGGITGGTDAEDDETFRARIFARLANPSGGGTWQNIAEASEESHPSVQKGFVYPAAQGPATVQVAVAGFSNWNAANVADASASREVDSTIVTNTITGFVNGTIPEHVYTVITSVVDSATDVAFQLSLPAAPSASPAGPGGGWLDAAPWPNNALAAANFRATVCSVTSNLVFEVIAPTAPAAGASRIAWLSPTTWQLSTGTVLSYTQLSGSAASITYSSGTNTITGLTGIVSLLATAGATITISGAVTGANNGTFPIATTPSGASVTVANASGATDGNNGIIVWSIDAWTVTVDTPFVGIAAGNLVFPQSVQQANYVTAVMSQFGLMGPGEVSSNPTVLQRGFRHPTTSLGWPYSLDATMLRALEDAGTEVLAAAYYYRSQTTPTPAGAGNAPLVLIPQNVAFYP